ncbi:MAG: NYN domain-containing protein [Nanoarchaeota archaeon]
MIKRVSIYIDGANFYYGLKTINVRYSDVFFDFEKFVKEIVGKDKLITIYYYNAPLKENFNKWVYWNQMKLFARLRKTPKCEVVLCKRQKRVDRDEQEYYVIKGDDENGFVVSFPMKGLAGLVKKEVAVANVPDVSYVGRKNDKPEIRYASHLVERPRLQMALLDDFPEAKKLYTLLVKERQWISEKLRQFYANLGNAQREFIFAVR